jgi:hypothetical protein
MSAAAIPSGPLPLGKSRRGPNVLELIAEPSPTKVGINDQFALAARPLIVTVMGAYVAPEGTLTIRFVSVALSTGAAVAPNQTTFSAGVGLKFVPDIAIFVPITPEVGLTAVILETPEAKL